MNKRSLLLLSLAGFLALGASWFIGYGMGKRAHYDAKEADRKAQVECLKQMWGMPFTLELHKEVRALEHDPEAVRALLLDAVTSSNLLALQKNPFLEIVPEAHDFFGFRAQTLLRLWKPGQTDIRKTPNPNGKDESPLWDLYLIDPKGASQRGVSSRGEGGK